MKANACYIIIYVQLYLFQVKQGETKSYLYNKNMSGKLLNNNSNFVFSHRRGWKIKEVYEKEEIEDTQESKEELVYIDDWNAWKSRDGYINNINNAVCLFRSFVGLLVPPFRHEKKKNHFHNPDFKDYKMVIFLGE